MTGFFPINASPLSALDNVKLDGLIHLSKGPYLQPLAFSRLDGTFCVDARSISNVLERFGVFGQRVGMQGRGCFE
jgi:hypothetical protein